MPKLAEAYVELTGRDARLKSSLAGGKRQVRNYASGVMRMMRPVLGLAGIGGLGFAFRTAVKEGAAFERQLASIGTMLSARTMPLMSGMADEIKRMADEYGEGTATLSKGLYDILSASIAATEATKVLEIAVRAAKAGFTTTAISADALTTILNAFAMQAGQAERVSDILLATVERGKLTYEELASTIGMVASTASVVGLSFEEVAAAIATMTRAGIRARTSTMSLNAIMLAFLKPTEEAVKLARELGFEMDAATIATEGLGGVLKRMAGLPPSAIAGLFPNVRALRGLSALLVNTRGFLEDVVTVTDSAGKTAEKFRTATDTLATRWEQFKQEILNYVRAPGAEGGRIGIGGRAVLDVAGGIPQGKGPGGWYMSMVSKSYTNYQDILEKIQRRMRTGEGGPQEFLPATAAGMAEAQGRAAAIKARQNQAAIASAERARLHDIGRRRASEEAFERLEAGRKRGRLGALAGEAGVETFGRRLDLASAIAAARNNATAVAKIQHQIWIREHEKRVAAKQKELGEQFHLVSEGFALERQQAEELHKLKLQNIADQERAKHAADDRELARMEQELNWMFANLDDDIPRARRGGVRGGLGFRPRTATAIERVGMSPRRDPIKYLRSMDQSLRTLVRDNAGMGMGP